MNRRATVLVAVLLFGFLAASPAAAQVMIRHGGGDENDVVFLRELGVVAGPRDGSEGLQLLVIMPGFDRQVPLKKGDLVLMIDGKRVRDVASLREIYEGAAVGDTVKLGFRRGDERFLTSFEKEDSEAQQGGVRMMMIGGPGSDFDDLQPLHEFGAILAEKDSKVVVAMRMPMGDAAFEEDDVLKSINGHDVGSLAAFREIYEPLPIGADIEVVVLRGDEKISASRVKAEATGAIRIRRGP